MGSRSPRAPFVRREGGQATLELALLLPVVAFVTAALVEIGLIAGDQLRLWHAAREAARVAVVDSDQLAARRAVSRHGFSRARVSVSPSRTERRQGDPLTVTLDYQRPPALPIVGLLFDNVVLNAQATMRIEQP